MAKVFPKFVRSYESRPSFEVLKTRLEMNARLAVPALRRLVGPGVRLSTNEARGRFTGLKFKSRAVPNPFLSHNFSVTFSAHPNSKRPSMMDVGFSKISGMDQSFTVKEYVEGSNSAPTRLPINKKSGYITFERGVSNTDVARQLLYWYADVAKALENGEPIPVMEVAITSAGGVPIPVQGRIKSRDVLAFELGSAWPQRVKISDFDANASEVLINSIRLAYRDISVVMLNNTFVSSSL